MRFAGRSVSLIVVATFLAWFAAACSNPADNKTEAKVGEAQPVPDSAGAAVVYTVDPDRSFVNWVGSKVTGSHNGGFADFGGTVELVDNDPTASSVTLEIDTATIWSDSEKLTGHLKSADFFEVETYPTATFRSTSIEATADGYMVTGNLDLHGVTKSVSFPAQITVAPDAVTAEAEFFIQRFDFDIVYPGKPDDLIRDEVVIHFLLTAVPEGGL